MSRHVPHLSAIIALTMLALGQITPAEAQPTFIERSPVATNANGANSVFAIDIDGDGDTDVLSASEVDDTVAWFENDGTQGFTRRNIVTNANGADSVFAADVDSDGDMDVLSASLNDDTVAWYENDGSQTFTRRNIATDADAASSG